MSTYSKLMQQEIQENASESTQVSTPKVTSVREPSRNKSRDISRKNARQSMKKVSKSRSRNKTKHTKNTSTNQLPTRNEIQEFSFSLRDAWKSKIQTEVPHEWQTELEDIARNLKVKKLGQVLFNQRKASVVRVIYQIYCEPNR